MHPMSRCHLWLLLLVVVLSADVARAQIKIDNIVTGKPLTSRGGGAAPETPESVVSVQAKFVAPAAGRPAMLAVTAKIKPGWHIYSTSQKPVQAEPTVITVDSGKDYRMAGEFRPNLPPHMRSMNGNAFEEYDGEATWQAPIDTRPGVDLKNIKIAGKVKIQTCREGACLQPHAFAFTAVLAPGAAPSAVEALSDPARHATLSGRIQPQSVAPGGQVKVTLQIDPGDGFHVYAFGDRDAGNLGYKPTLIVLTNSSGFPFTRPAASAEPMEEPSPIEGELPQLVYEQPVEWTTTITIPKDTKPGVYEIAGLVGYQVCQKINCDLPRGASFTSNVTVGASSGKGSVPLAFSEARYVDAARLAATQPVSREAAVVGAQPAALSTLPMVILASLIGGFILNFMPCVLPVIGLKILSFAEQAGRSRGQILALNVWYSLGLLSVFLVLATLASGVNLGLREQDLGWGEQFSSTSFNIVMVSVVFVMALSFLGVWEIPIPGFVGTGAANEVAAREGPLGAFAKGILTTVLATPCSGPLLGPVFAFTLNQPPLVTFLIFGSIGLGMASPYLVIGAFPQLVRFLPKPGAWMDTFKQMMGFVMLGTIVFLFTFMNRDYVVPTFALMVGLWAACWWIGRTSLVEPLGRVLKAWGQGAVVAAVVGFVAFTQLTPHESKIPWKSFSQAELAKLTSEGNTVLVDFTAQWCLTCKMNLRFAIETESVKDLLATNKVVPLLADWTDGSPEIKEALAGLDSNSIPVLAIYPAGDPEHPIVLRDVITQNAVLDAIKQAGPSKGGQALSVAMP